MPRILILEAGHLWSNPRSQKEADALAGAGHQVSTGGIWFDQAGVDRDFSVASGRVWKFEPFLDLRPTTRIGRARNLLARSRNRLAREAYSRLGIRSPSLFGYGTREMLRTVGASSLHYCSVRESRDDLPVRMREFAQSRIRYGYRRTTALLKCEARKQNRFNPDFANCQPGALEGWLS